MLFHILNERVILQFWLVLSNKKVWNWCGFVFVWQIL